MDLHGKNILGDETSADGTASYQAVDPATDGKLEPGFHEATATEVDRALELAATAVGVCRSKSADEIASFLDRIADEILESGDALIDRACRETGLPTARIQGERGRTVNQLRMFADLVREGSWVEARIDHAIPDREPIPKPDVRRMLLPIGPVVVFGASNFPLAFSVAGGDTASALAAGNPVVVKAQRAHPGTSEIVGSAIQRAAAATGMPPGIFSLLHGKGREVGVALVKHPHTRAVGFTGSHQGGRALFDAAAGRSRPIPVYAEMGSFNPVFLLPGALAESGEAIAVGLAQSVTLGVGQFCTNPGVVVGIAGNALDAFTAALRDGIASSAAGTMLHRGILETYEREVESLASRKVKLEARSGSAARPEKTEARACFFSTDAEAFLSDDKLAREVFGPATMLVTCRSAEQLHAVAAALDGHLTATIHGTAEDLVSHRSLLAILETKVGRLVFNGFPTGVEVCPSMHHGGPYQATTDARGTSVGTAAIGRFARPVCFQDFPAAALPEELRDDNPRSIQRLVDGKWTRPG